MASLKKGSVPKPAVSVPKWEQPAIGWFKVNTDAGFLKDSEIGSGGVVIRDHAGLVAAGSARWLDDVPDALTAEAMAAREGLELAVELGLDKVVLEVDCQELSNLLHSSNSKSSSIGGLCFDIIELGKGFNDFCIRWVGRGANSVANCCATLVTPYERCLFWIDEIPSWLANLAAADCNPDSVE